MRMRKLQHLPLMEIIAKVAQKVGPEYDQELVDRREDMINNYDFGGAGTLKKELQAAQINLDLIAEFVPTTVAPAQHRQRHEGFYRDGTQDDFTSLIEFQDHVQTVQEFADARAELVNKMDFSGLACLTKAIVEAGLDLTEVEKTKPNVAMSEVLTDRNGMYRN